jgi:hypothetical protein
VLIFIVKSEDEIHDTALLLVHFLLNVSGGNSEKIFGMNLSLIINILHNIYFSSAVIQLPPQPHSLLLFALPVLQEACLFTCSEAR